MTEFTVNENENETGSDAQVPTVAEIPAEVWRGMAECASPKDHRKVLTCAQYKDGRLVATDGKRLLSWGPMVGAPAGEVLVPFPVAKELGKAGNVRAVLDVAGSVAEGAPVKAEVEGKKGARSALYGDKVEGKFPEVDAVIPQGEPAFRVAFDADVLSDVCKAVARFSGGRVACNSVLLEVHGPNRPCLIRPVKTELADGPEVEREAFGLAMPVKLLDATDEAWAPSRADAAEELRKGLKWAGVDLGDKGREVLAKWAEGQALFPVPASEE